MSGGDTSPDVVKAFASVAHLAPAIRWGIERRRAAELLLAEERIKASVMPQTARSFWPHVFRPTALTLSRLLAGTTR